jgi:signal transduction histidine kinase
MAGQGTMPDAATAAAVRTETIRTLFRANPWIFAISPVNAAIVGAVLWMPGRGALIVAWVVLMAAVAAVRWRVRARFFAAETPDHRVWARRFVLAAASSGVLWGAGSLLLYAPGDHTSELILVFVLGGMTAGAAGTLAYFLPAFFAFTAPVLLPLAVRFLFEGDTLHVAMGLLGIVFGGALSIVARNTNRAITQAFRLGFENDALLAHLSRARAALEESNRTLEQRVQERGAALKRQTEALYEARRVESLGLLVGGVAHDFNNLLTVILGNAALLEDNPAVAGEPEGPIAEIRKASERAAALVGQLLASSRRQARTPRVLDLNATVREAQRLLARLLGEHIEIVVQLADAPLPIDADPGQLEQVIVNLATNARDAMPKGGTLTIETEALEVPSGGSPGARGLAAGPYVVLSVRDTGIGMDAETMRLAFHPFFTTKEVGRGTGLGLATVSGVVEQSGGHVLVDSAPGKGSCFRVFLPRAQASIAEAAAPAKTAPPRRAATVLLVEDEPSVRGVISRALEGAGMTVLAADNGEDALSRARRHQGPIDLLVTDVVMARMGGPELAARLVGSRPDVRVLYISGYGADAEPLSGYGADAEPLSGDGADAEPLSGDGAGAEPLSGDGRGREAEPLPGKVRDNAAARAGVDFLQKPFSSSALVERVSRLLGVRRAAEAR